MSDEPRYYPIFIVTHKIVDSGLEFSRKDDLLAELRKLSSWLDEVDADARRLHTKAEELQGIIKKIRREIERGETGEASHILQREFPEAASSLLGVMRKLGPPS